VSTRQITVLPAGISIERIAPGLFEVTHATEDGAASALMDMWDLQQMIDALSGELAG
jgi:hypothetical protein